MLNFSTMSVCLVAEIKPQKKFFLKTVNSFTNKLFIKKRNCVKINSFKKWKIKAQNE